jgi:hypothetical protein
MKMKQRGGSGTPDSPVGNTKKKRRTSTAGSGANSNNNNQNQGSSSSPAAQSSSMPELIPPPPMAGFRTSGLLNPNSKLILIDHEMKNEVSIHIHII